jgi:hypothetical protein
MKNVMINGAIYNWTPKEEIQILKNLDGMCADVNNDPEAYEVNVTFYHRDLEYCVAPHTDRPREIVYTITRLYRNSKGDIIDDEIVHNSKYARTILPSIIRRMVNEVRHTY